MKHGRLRRKSRKRAAREREVAPIRREYLELFPRCSMPGCKREACECHEITAGYGKRQLATGERALILGTCRWCHPTLQAKPHAWQLALKRIVDPEGFCLETYRRVMCPWRKAVIVSIEDVTLAAQEIFG